MLRLLLALSLCTTGCDESKDEKKKDTAEHAGEKRSAEGTDAKLELPATQPLSLNVAIYRWVPRPEQFQDELRSQWDEKKQGVSLNFVKWDAYDLSDPPEDLDVFVFDAIFLDYFAASNVLRPFKADEVSGSDDFLPYAREGVLTETGEWWAIPQLGCADLLFYRDDDKELAAAKDLKSVSAALGTCVYEDEEPPKGKGLLLDSGGGTTNACHYIDAAQDLAHKYSATPELPLPKDLTKAVLDNLRLEIAMASEKQARKDYGMPYGRARAFDEGVGRALIGFTESMSVMSKMRDHVNFRVMPLGPQPDVDLFYADVVGVNAKVPESKRAAAVELANLMASTEYISVVFGPSADDPSPQYLLPTRTSVFASLAQFPIYEEMKRMVDDSEPRLLRLGPNSVPWLKAHKSAIRSAIYDESPCDQGSPRGK